MTTNTPHPPGRETSGHTGAGLIGDLRTGIDAGREGREARERALEREAGDTDSQGGDTSVAGGPGTSTPAGVSRIGSGTTGLNNYSPGSDLSARLTPDAGEGSLAGTTGGERASAGINDANRSSRDHGSSLDG